MGRKASSSRVGARILCNRLYEQRELGTAFVIILAKLILNVNIPIYLLHFTSYQTITCILFSQTTAVLLTGLLLQITTFMQVPSHIIPREPTLNLCIPVFFCICLY